MSALSEPDEQVALRTWLRGVAGDAAADVVLEVGGMPAGCVCGLRLERPLEDHPLGPRWLAWSESDPLPRIVQSVPRLGGSWAAEEARSALEPLTRFVHAHAVAPRDVEVWGDGLALVLTYHGTYEGTLTLSRLLSLKPQGQMDARQSALVGVHLLGALSAAHQRGLGHGSLGIDGVIVDGRGRALIDAFGVESALMGEDPDAAASASVRSVAAIVYELVTGLGPATSVAPAVPAARLVRSLPTALARFLERGLADDGGFAGPGEALAVLV